MGIVFVPKVGNQLEADSLRILQNITFLIWGKHRSPYIHFITIKSCIKHWPRSISILGVRNKEKDLVQLEL